MASHGAVGISRSATSQAKSKQRGKQTNRERKCERVSMGQTETEHKNQKSMSELATFSGYREVIAITDLRVIYVMCVCSYAQCVESACHWIIITATPNVREEAEVGGAPSMRDWRDLTSMLVSSCLIYFMTQHISRTTDTTLIPRHTKNTCHDAL